jgi:histidine triad (HIT) family protein
LGPIECVGCEIVAGRQTTPGGFVHQTEHFVVHALAGASPIAGWMVLTSRVHARGIYDLPDEALSAIGPLAARVMKEQKKALGAEHVYAMAIGDALLHSHLHLIPRYLDTAAQLRGCGAFRASPEMMLTFEAVSSAAVELARALGG